MNDPLIDGGSKSVKERPREREMSKRGGVGDRIQGLMHARPEAVTLVKENEINEDREGDFSEPC